MDETSETESQGRNSKVDEDGSTIPAIITDEYFDDIALKCRAVSCLLNHFSFSLIFVHFEMEIRRRCAAY